MENIISLVPKLPPEVQKYMDEHGFKLHCSRGYWFVIGEEDGEPFELTPELFIAIYNHHYK